MAGSCEKAAEAGVVLHQPLNRRIFLDFAKNGQNLNGIPVCPGRKTQNAPTWQVENTASDRPFFRLLEVHSALPQTALIFFKH